MWVLPLTALLLQSLNDIITVSDIGKIDGISIAAKDLDMKEGIHPDYIETAVTCGCGNSFTTRSTRSQLKVDICNMCHPFFTGKLKYIDTAGRIEKFQNKFAAGSYASLQPDKKKKKKPAKSIADS